MNSFKSKLNKNCLLLNKITITNKQSQIVRIGNDFYIFRILYVITKDNIINDTKNKKITFYLKTKMSIKKDICYTKPLDDDIIVESYRSLIILITNFCKLEDINKYKIIIFNSDLHSIEGNEQLMNYKDKIIYAKIKINIKKNENEKNNNNFIKLKKVFSTKLLPIKQLDDKGNIIDNNDQSFSPLKISPSKNTLLNFKPTNEYNINNNILSKSFKSTISKNTSSSDDRIHNNNTIYNIKKLLRKKLIKNNYNNPVRFNFYSFDFGKEENETYSSRIFINKLQDIITKRKKINKFANANINNSFLIHKLNKSKSEFECFKKKNQILKQKILDAGKIFNNVKQCQNKGIQVMDIDKIDKSYNNKQNYIYNNFFNNIIKKHDYSALLKKKKNNSIFSLKIRHNMNLNQSDGFKSMKTNDKIFNKTFLIKNCIHSDQFNNLKTIYRYLKYPKMQKEQNMENKKSQSEDRNKILINNLKDLYDECLFTIDLIINNINDYFPDVSDFIKQVDVFFLEKFKHININNCLKQFLLYSFIDNFIEKEKDISIKSLINILNDNITEEEYKKGEEYLIYLFEKIIKTKENKTFDLINYVQSKNNIKDIIITKEFFFIFIFCSNYFDKMQREIGKRMLINIDIKDKIDFNKYSNYYLYFIDNKSLTLENKLNFITKFIYIIESGCTGEGNPILIKKFVNEVLYIFRIDERSRRLLLGNIEIKDMKFLMKKKINDVFNSMVNFFRSNFFNFSQIMNLN